MARNVARWVLPVVLVAAVGSGCRRVKDVNAPAQGSPLAEVASWCYQLQNVNPTEVARAGFDLAVLDYSWEGSEDGLLPADSVEAIRSSGVITLAYISIGEAEKYRFYWRDEWQQQPPEWLGKENEYWPGNWAVQYWRPEWRQIVFQYVGRIIERGFSGLYLDRVDAYEHWSDPENDEELVLDVEDAARRMIRLVEDIADLCEKLAGSDFCLVPQNGEGLMEYDHSGRLLRLVDGWAAEDLYYDGTVLLPAAVTTPRLALLNRVRRAGKPVFSVDYVDDGSGYAGENAGRIDDYRRRARERGYIPYVARSDRELDELNLIPGVQP